MITNEVVTDPSILDPLSTPEETLPQRPPLHTQTRVWASRCVGWSWKHPSAVTAVEV